MEWDPFGGTVLEAPPDLEERIGAKYKLGIMSTPSLRCQLRLRK